MKPCETCKHRTAGLAWMIRKGAPIDWVPLCPKCVTETEEEEDQTSDISPSTQKTHA